MAKFFGTIIIIVASFIGFSQSSKNPLDCSYPSPWATDRPDTIQAFILLSGNLPRTKLPACTPVTNTGFKTANFSISWIAVSSRDIKDYVASTAKKSSLKLTDSSSCYFFHKMHRVFIYRLAKDYIAIIFEENVKEQDQFFLAARNRKKLQKGFDYLNRYFIYQ